MDWQVCVKQRIASTSGSEARAVCVKRAYTDLCGGRSAMIVASATAGSVSRSEAIVAPGLYFPTNCFTFAMSASAPVVSPAARRAALRLM